MLCNVFESLLSQVWLLVSLDLWIAFRPIFLGLDSNVCCLIIWCDTCFSFGRRNNLVVKRESFVACLCVCDSFTSLFVTRFDKEDTKSCFSSFSFHPSLSPSPSYSFLASNCLPCVTTDSIHAIALSLNWETERETGFSPPVLFVTSFSSFSSFSCFLYSCLQSILCLLLLCPQLISCFRLILLRVFTSIPLHLTLLLRRSCPHSLELFSSDPLLISHLLISLSKQLRNEFLSFSFFVCFASSLVPHFSLLCFSYASLLCFSSSSDCFTWCHICPLEGLVVCFGLDISCLITSFLLYDIFFHQSVSQTLRCHIIFENLTLQTDHKSLLILQVNFMTWLSSWWRQWTGLVLSKNLMHLKPDKKGCVQWKEARNLGEEHEMISPKHKILSWWRVFKARASFMNF